MPIEIYYSGQSPTVKITWVNGNYKKLTLTILNSSIDNCFITITTITRPFSFLKDIVNIEDYLNYVVLKQDQNVSENEDINFYNKDFETKVINLLEEILNKRDS